MPSLIRRLLPAEGRALSYSTIFRTGLDTLPGRPGSGIMVTEDTALGSSAVWACIRLITGDIASLPVHAYRRTPSGRAELPMQPAWLCDPDPFDPTVTWTDHMTQVVMSLLLDGNAFVYVEPDVFAPARLEVLNPRVIQVRQDGRAPAYDVLDSRGHVSQTLTPLNMLHVPLFRRPGSLRGINPIQAFQENIGLSLAAEKFGARFFGNGAVLSGVIETPGDLTTPQADELRSKFEARHGGWRQSHSVGVLTGGAKFTPLSLSQKDSQFIELRVHQVEEAARIYGIPPHMIGSQQPGASSYASVSQRSLDYVNHALVHYVTPIERAYSRLVPGDRRLTSPGSDTYIRFNFAGLLRGDPNERANFYNALWSVGAASPDEIRALEEMEPLANGRGSLHYVQTSYAAIDAPVPAAPEPTEATPNPDPDSGDPIVLPTNEPLIAPAVTAGP